MFTLFVRVYHVLASDEVTLGACGCRKQQQKSGSAGEGEQKLPRERVHGKTDDAIIIKAIVDELYRFNAEVVMFHTAGSVFKFECALVFKMMSRLNPMLSQKITVLTSK